MRLGIAILAGLLAGGGYAWWLHKQSMQDKTSLSTRDKTDSVQAKPLYRWTDDAGITQITDTPPNGRPYKKVNIRPDQNIVPMLEPATEPTNAQ